MMFVRILALAFVALAVAEPEPEPKKAFFTFSTEEPRKWNLDDIKRTWNTDYYKRWSSTEAPKYFWSSTEAPRTFWSTTEAPRLFWSTTEAARRWPYYNDASRYNYNNLYSRFNEDANRYNSQNKYWGSNYFNTLYGNYLPQIPDLTTYQPQIISAKDQQQYILNLSAYKQLSLTVKVRGDYIYIQGHEEITPSLGQNYASVNQFVHTFTLPPRARGNEVTAVLSSDGYLIITAPIRSYGFVSNVDYDVPVTTSEEAYLQRPLAAEIKAEPALTSNSEPAAPAAESSEKEKEEEKPVEKPLETTKSEDPAPSKPALTFATLYPTQKYPPQQYPTPQYNNLYPAQPTIVIQTYPAQASQETYSTTASAPLTYPTTSAPTYFSSQETSNYSTEKSVESVPSQTSEQLTAAQPAINKPLRPKPLVKAKQSTGTLTPLTQVVRA